jgi:hypothetical protein
MGDPRSSTRGGKCEGECTGFAESRMDGQKCGRCPPALFGAGGQRDAVGKQKQPGQGDPLARCGLVLIDRSR